MIASIKFERNAYGDISEGYCLIARAVGQGPTLLADRHRVGRVLTRHCGASGDIEPMAQNDMHVQGDCCVQLVASLVAG